MKMQIWRLLDTGGNNGFYNMAVDEAISIACREGAVLPTLRFYTWLPQCVSIGYFQKVDRVLTRIGLERDHTEIVRRITGGRAVFHGNDLSYSIVSNTNNKLFPNNINGTYDIIANAFITGLKFIGITPDPFRTLHSAPKTRNYHHSTLCFANTLGHEISVSGKKLIGSAQRRESNVFLQHGSILITENRHEDNPNSTTLKNFLGDNPDIKAITAAIAAGCCESLGIELVRGHLTQYEIDLTKRLIEEKYSKTSWNEKYGLPEPP